MRNGKLAKLLRVWEMAQAGCGIILKYLIGAGGVWGRPRRLLTKRESPFPCKPKLPSRGLQFQYLPSRCWCSKLGVAELRIMWDAKAVVGFDFCILISILNAVKSS
jgi:hypothetical protein